VRVRGNRRGRGQSATLRVCVTCRWKGLQEMEDEAIRPGERLFQLVRDEAGPDQKDRIQDIVCLTHCMNACNAVAMQRGKTPLLMTQMAPDRETARALLAMLDAFNDSETGMVADDQVPDEIPLARPLVPPGVSRSRGRS
jgi:predicted metal-binding protein